MHMNSSSYKNDHVSHLFAPTLHKFFQISIQGPPTSLFLRKSDDMIVIYENIANLKHLRNFNDWVSHNFAPVIKKLHPSIDFVDLTICYMYAQFSTIYSECKSPKTGLQKSLCLWPVSLQISTNFYFERIFW